MWYDKSRYSLVYLPAFVNLQDPPAAKRRSVMKKCLSRLVASLLAAVLLAAPASALTVDQALELLEDNYY